ncbi:hypothetical protein F5050DRAFT_1712377 [Lentinula boryana]|uniref:Mid2 domain-containing protein n=1 Tax=Lentinula boryana TaxID=40481 RepID=A0ABQ8QC08_9AGAR|nr:hypothetical protein F5050DRAFT_1712377 [Lentinula boryana]
MWGVCGRFVLELLRIDSEERGKIVRKVVAGALSISFPPKGTPTAGLNSQMVSWKRDKRDPNAQFVLQKIKLDDPDGPTPKSTPVPILNSQNNEGESTMVFNRAGLFQIIAVDIQNEQTFFSTEITVLPNPTSSASPSSRKPMMTKMNNTSAVSSSPSSTANDTFGSSDPIASSKTPVPSAPNNDKSTTTDDRLTKNTTAIIGGVVGVIGLAFVLGVTLLCFRYRTRRRTEQFVQTKIGRDFIPNSMEDQWDLAEKEKGADQYPSAFFPPTRRGTLRPQDSVSNIHERHVPSILPPIPAARHFAGSMVPSSVSSTSSTRRARDRKTPSLSLSTQSFSDSSAASSSLFPIPVLPPRTRTDRQMMIEEDIQQLQARMLFLQGNGAISSTVELENEEQLRQIDKKVELLKKAHESDWAMGSTDETPVGRF